MVATAALLYLRHIYVYIAVCCRSRKFREVWESCCFELARRRVFGQLVELRRIMVLSSSHEFGGRFGRLVRTLRGAEGMTQEALAVAAFGDPARKSDISLLENGKIKNPRQKTVDALVVALDIDPEDVMSLMEPSTSKNLDQSNPDIEIFDISLKKEVVQEGELINVNYQVKNIGSPEIENKVFFYVSRDKKLDPMDMMIGRNRHGTLRKSEKDGETAYIVDEYLNTADVKEGKYHLIVVIKGKEAKHHDTKKYFSHKFEVLKPKNSANKDIFSQGHRYKNNCFCSEWDEVIDKTAGDGMRRTLMLNVAKVKLTQGMREVSPTLLLAAIEELRACLALQEANNNGREIAEVKNALGEALFELSKISDEPALANEALALFEEALDSLKE